MGCSALAVKVAKMDQTTLSRILEPVGHSNTRSVFQIDREGIAFLDVASLRLVCSYTATVAAAAVPLFPAATGAYSMVREVNVKLPTGQTIFSLRQAHQFAAFQLARRGCGFQGDRAQYEFASGRVLKTGADGIVVKQTTFSQYPTAVASTTPQFELNLSMLVDPLARGLFPLARLPGALTIEILWEDTLATIFQAAAAITAGTYNVVQPQLCYDLVRADEAYMKLPKQVDIVFEEPVYSSQAFKAVAAATTYSLPLGFSGLRVRRLMVSSRLYDWGQIWQPDIECDVA